MKLSLQFKRYYDGVSEEYNGGNMFKGIFFTSINDQIVKFG